MVGAFPLHHSKYEWEGFVVAMGDGSCAGSPLLLKTQHKGWRVARNTTTSHFDQQSGWWWPGSPSVARNAI